MPYPIVALELLVELRGSGLADRIFYSGPAITRNHVKGIRLRIQQLGHEGALLFLQVLQHQDLVVETLLSLRTPERFVNAPVVSDPN